MRMFDIEKQKEKFKNHKATFADYGNIKILDFKALETSDYRIRFLFEEDYCRLHITGDLGSLIATNYNNMTYEKFSDFVNNVGYFEGKIDCHERAIYYYSTEKARTDIIQYLKEYDLYDFVIEHEDYYFMGEEDEIVTAFLDEVLEDFDEDRGIGTAGYRLLSQIDSDIWESVSDFGKCKSGILETYMLAFTLAQKQLREAETE